MNADSLIIENSHKASAWARIRDAILSAALWALYLYMIRDLFIDLYLMTRESFDWMFDGSARPSMPQISRLFATLWIYFLIILANGWLLIFWGLYNQIRFRGTVQPAAVPLVTVEDLAALYQLSAEDIAAWQGSRLITMRHSDDGTLEKVVARDAVLNATMPPTVSPA